MANSTQYVRSQLEIENVGEGTVLHIYVRYQPTSKKVPIRVMKNPCPTWLNAGRFVLQLMEEFKLHVDRERKRK